MATTAKLRIDGDASGALRSIQQIQSALGGIQRAAQSAQTALAGIVGGLATGGLFNFVDGLQNMQNKLRVVTGSQQEFNNAMQAVRDVSDKTGQSLTATGDLYSKVATNAERLGFNQDQVVTITNSFATALKVGGASAQSAGAAMYQFGQILNKNRIEGDDFNTIMEAVGGKTMTALADSLGVSTEKLKEFASKGLLNGQDLARGFINIIGSLDSQVDNTSQTLGQSLQRIQNAFATTIIEIDKATGFSKTFADVANKIASNGANLVPVLKAIGAALLALGIYFAPVITLFGAATAAALYFADILGPILKPVITVIENLLAGLTRRLMAFGSAIAAVAKGENPFEAYRKSMAEFERQSQQSTATATEGQKRLAAAAQQAAQSMPKPDQNAGLNQQVKKLIDELTRQANISGASTKEYELQSQLLGINKQFNYELTASQRNQIQNLITQIDLQKNLAKINEDIAGIYKDITANSAADIGDRRVAVELENRRRQYGDTAFKAKEKELRAAIESNLQAEAARNFMDQTAKFAYEMRAIYAQNTVELEVMRKLEETRAQYGQRIADSQAAQVRQMVEAQVIAREELRIERESALLSGEFTTIQTELNQLSVTQLNAKIKIFEIEHQIGIELDDSIKLQIASNLETRKMIDNYREIHKSIQAINQAQTGDAAGAMAAGQLGSLDPVTAARTANETLYNGLQFLRDSDLISEKQYQTARISAAVSAQQAIFDAEKKMFENKAQLRIQERTGTQFGYETQKQMAAEAASFEMKSTMEKTQFAIEQSASIMNSLGASNRKAFEAAKAFNIANAVMNTYMGATKALATYPPPFNFIAAAAVVAMGLAQVAAIRSQQYSGRQLGGPVMGGTPYLVGENGPELFTPNTTGSITRNSDLGGGGVTNVNFYVTANDTTGFDELLSSRKTLITQIIRDAHLERGVRGVM